MTALPPPEPKAGEFAFAGLFVGGLYGLASFVPALSAGIPIIAVTIFPSVGYLIGTILDQRTAA